jgi:hypothetical protein
MQRWARALRHASAAKMLNHLLHQCSAIAAPLPLPPRRLCSSWWKVWRQAEILSCLWRLRSATRPTGGRGGLCSLCSLWMDRQGAVTARQGQSPLHASSMLGPATRLSFM